MPQRSPAPGGGAGPIRLNVSDAPRWSASGISSPPTRPHEVSSCARKKPRLRAEPMGQQSMVGRPHVGDPGNSVEDPDQRRTTIRSVCGPLDSRIRASGGMPALVCRFACLISGRLFAGVSVQMVEGHGRPLCICLVLTCRTAGEGRRCQSDYKNCAHGRNTPRLRQRKRCREGSALNASRRRCGRPPTAGTA